MKTFSTFFCFGMALTWMIFANGEHATTAAWTVGGLILSHLPNR